MRSHDDRCQGLEEALTDRSFDAAVDMVLSSPARDRFRATSADGSVTFERRTVTVDDHDGVPVERHEFTIVDLDRKNPLADGSTDRFSTSADEARAPFPNRDANAYPHAYDQIAQFFDSAHAPELVVQHAPSHRFGTNLGEHGSLGVVQARAPFVASGAGVVRAGIVNESARMVDVAPTILRLLGTDPHPDSIGPTGARRRAGLLRRQDGDPLTFVHEGGADHVVVVLLDGCNPNQLYDAIAHGDAPAIGSLLGGGTALGLGLMASLPTATLANHTTASTGVHPGHSGVLHHMRFDRERRVTPDLLAFDEMFAAMVHLRPDVETLHEAIHRSRPDAFTAAVFEFCDRGADVSSFADFRSGRAPSFPDITATSNAAMADSSDAYAFMSAVDELATTQAISLWNREAGNPLPTFMFLSLSLTDEAGHEGGPHSEIVRAAVIDSDRRVERVLDAIDRSGARDRTAILVMSDHGMEAHNPAHDRPWSDLRDEALADVGTRVRDVADGWLYIEQ